MARSVWKGPLWTLCPEKGRESSRERPQRSDQDLVAPFDHPAAVRGSHLWCLQRQEAHPRNVIEDMIGQKFGEYSPTRTYYGHAADKKAKRK